MFVSADFQCNETERNPNTTTLTTTYTYNVFYFDFIYVVVAIVHSRKTVYETLEEMAFLLRNINQRTEITIHMENDDNDNDIVLKLINMMK